MGVAWRIIGRILLCGVRQVQRQAGRCATCKTVFDTALEQDGNTNIVVRRNSATGETTRVHVHRWCRPDGPRGRPRTRWQMLE